MINSCDVLVLKRSLKIAREQSRVELDDCKKGWLDSSGDVWVPIHGADMAG